MARDQKTVSASLVAVIVKTKRNPQGFVLGFAANVSVGVSLINSIERGVGYGIGRENVHHGVAQASVSWDTAYTPTENAQVIGALPERMDNPEIAAHEPITVLLFNKDRGEFLAEIVEVLADNIGINAGAQSTIRESFSGTGLAARLFNDLNAA